MAHTFAINGGAGITLAPESLAEEVMQNITMILSTAKNTAPLAREFGLTARFVDMPTPAAEAILVAEVLDAVEEYEPRAEVLDITFTRDEMTGLIVPRLEVEIHDSDE